MRFIQPIRFTGEPVGIATLVAIGVHLMVILGISFDLSRTAPPAPKRTIDINLVIPAHTPKPLEAPDFLAQVSQQGGGKKAQPAQAASPLRNPEVTRKKKPKPELKPSGTTKPQAQKRPQIIAQERPQKDPVVNTAETVKAPPKLDLAELLASSQKEIDLLTAELDNSVQASANQPRRKAINASTQEYQYAAYLDAWRKKVERVGNLNYPDEARRNKLYGTLLLHVAVRADGSLERVRLLRSSGHKVLDDAAKRIVSLSAPFAPFPPNIRQEVDVLDITRTWQFRTGQGFFGNN